MLKISNYRFIRFIVFAVLLCLTGCQTTKVEYVENDSLPKEKLYRISEVFLKGGSVIHLKGTEAKFKARYKGRENVIIYYDKDYNRLFIELKEVDKVKIEIIEPNVGVTVLLIVGILAVLFVLTFFIALATSKGGIAH